MLNEFIGFAICLKLQDAHMLYLIFEVEYWFES